jgi:manganese transport protein
LWRLLGPAFVAAVAYVDPGNVAANLSAGSVYGYSLVWVLVLANVMAVVMQYLSAKLGLVTGRSLAQLVGQRLSRPARLAYWAQAQLVAVATDLAEVVGGAVALRLLCGFPLLVGGLIIGALSLALLAVQGRGGRAFEVVVVVFLGVITIGFVSGLAVAPVDPAAVLGGLRPRLADSGAVFLAAAMLGATVMPHAIYLHSAAARDHAARLALPQTSRADSGDDGRGRVGLSRLLKANRWDVWLALVVAGSVNIGLLVLAAASLYGQGEISLDGAHDAIRSTLGPVVAGVFALGLLASGLASTSVGAYAGASVTEGLLRVKIPIWGLRLMTLAPALAVLAAGLDPTRALVVSQVVLSFGLPFAVIPLVRLTSQRATMGRWASRPWLVATAWVVVALVVALNLALLVQSLGGDWS